MKIGVCGQAVKVETEPELSIILSAYNEEDIIEQVLDRVDHVDYGSKYEIIVVDDGSVDDTRKKAENYANGNGHVKVVGYERNIGKGNAIRTGLAYARGGVVAFVDCDLDINPKQIVNYVNALACADIAIALKWHPKSHLNIPLKRRFLSHAFNVLARLLTGIKFRDTQTGLKAFRRGKLNKIFSKLGVNGYAFDVELLAASNHCGLKVTELPVEIQSYSMLNLREMLRMFIDLLGIAYKLRVLKYYQRPIRRFEHAFEHADMTKTEKLKIPLSNHRCVYSEQIQNE